MGGTTGFTGVPEQKDARATGGKSGGAAHGSRGGEPPDAWAKFKEAVVNVAKPVLRQPFERNEITRDVFKQITKKAAEKVVSSFKKEGVPPPANNEIDAKQRGKIQKLVKEYLSLSKKA